MKRSRRFAPEAKDFIPASLLWTSGIPLHLSAWERGGSWLIFFSLYKKVRGEYNRTIMPLQTLLTLFISPCRRGVIWRCAHAGLMFSLLASGSFYSHFMRWCMCVGVFVHDCPIIQQLILKHRGQNLKERAVLANMLILFIFSPYWFAFDPLYSVCMCVWREEN